MDASQNAALRIGGSQQDPAHSVTPINAISTPRASHQRRFRRSHTPVNLPPMAASRLSLPIATVAFVALAGLGSHQFFKDGSFWLDEASLALSLLRLEPLQSFGPLIGGQSFPRLYLLAVHGLVDILGYQTLVVRLRPYIFFVAATFAWLRRLSERFRNQPQWIGLGALLAVVMGLVRRPRKDPT